MSSYKKCPKTVLAGAAALAIGGMLASSASAVVITASYPTQDNPTHPLNQSYTDDLNGLVPTVYDREFNVRYDSTHAIPTALTNAVSPTSPSANVVLGPDAQDVLPKSHVVWDLGAEDAALRQLDVFSIWIDAGDQARSSYGGYLSTSMDGVTWTQIPGTAVDHSFGRGTTAFSGGFAYPGQFNNLQYQFEPGEVLGFRYLAFTEIGGIGGSWRRSARMVETDGFITIIPEPSALGLIGLGGLAMIRRRRA